MSTLTLIGLPLSVTGIGNALPKPQEMRRNLYPDQAACARDDQIGGIHAPTAADNIQSR
jgi:hypothetical protein